VIAAELYGSDGADPAMKFTGELSVKAPRAAVYRQAARCALLRFVVDGVRDLAEIGPDRYAAVFRDQGSRT